MTNARQKYFVIFRIATVSAAGTPCCEGDVINMKLELARDIAQGTIDACHKDGYQVVGGDAIKWLPSDRYLPLAGPP